MPKGKSDKFLKVAFILLVGGFASFFLVIPLGGIGPCGPSTAAGTVVLVGASMGILLGTISLIFALLGFALRFGIASRRKHILRHSGNSPL